MHEQNESADYFEGSERIEALWDALSRIEMVAGTVSKWPPGEMPADSILESVHRIAKRALSKDAARAPE